MLHLAKKLLWRIAAIVLLGLGIIGAFLPVLPTVPFVLAAAWCASKGWPELEAWLLAHPRFGRAILEWREYRVVPRRTKLIAIFMMTCSALMVQFLPLPAWALWLRWALPLLFVLVGSWLWRQAEIVDDEPKKPYYS